MDRRIKHRVYAERVEIGFSKLPGMAVFVRIIRGDCTIAFQCLEVTGKIARDYLCSAGEGVPLFLIELGADKPGVVIIKKPDTGSLEVLHQTSSGFLDIFHLTFLELLVIF